MPAFSGPPRPGLRPGRNGLAPGNGPAQNGWTCTALLAEQPAAGRDQRASLRPAWAAYTTFGGSAAARRPSTAASPSGR
jgi:hypothetical protein